MDYLMTQSDRINHVLSSSVIVTFYRLWIPSLLGLLALTTANIVDGLFIGNYVGSNALAAVNLIIPFFGILFGLSFMFAMGGSVRAGKYIGEKNYTEASNIFSKTVIAIISLVGLIILLGLTFETNVLRALGGTDEVLPLMKTYYRITMGFIWTQLLTVALYFFVRLDGYPNLASFALILGSAVNIGLDYLFVAHLGWGIAGAAWATGISQALPFIVLCSYFLQSNRHLNFYFHQTRWRELFQSAANGLSEFVNEISGAIIVLILNWLFVLRYGVDGVAAFTILNYLLMIGMMFGFSIGEAGSIFISQNFGARQVKRIQQFLLVSALNALVIAVIFIAFLVGFSEFLVTMFLPDNEMYVIELANELMELVWPVFLVSGLTMIITSYLTALHLPKPSAIIALSRSLVLPILLLLVLFKLLPEYPFILAIPLAELFTFGIALFFFWYFPPKQQTLDRITNGCA